MDDPVNDFKNNLPSHIHLVDSDDSHLLLSDDRYPLTIIEIPLIGPFPSISEIESRFAQLNTDPGIGDYTRDPTLGHLRDPPAVDGSCLFPTDNVFAPVKPNGDWYFNPESSLFSTEYTIDHRPSKTTIDRMRFPRGARIYPMSPVKLPGRGKTTPREFYTLDPDSDPDPEPKYPFSDRDL